MRLHVQVTVLRGPIAESRHRVQCVVVDASGAVVASGDDPALATSFRSSAKPFQLLPLVERGHADRLGFSDEQLAIMAASHSGAAHHLALVRGVLDRIGARVEQLACGFHEPQDPDSLEDVRRHPEKRSPLYNNCSGKHAGMLALAQAEGWPLEGYERPEHPLQQLMRRSVGECCGEAPESLPVAVDGCSVCVFGLPLAAMARGYARIAEAWSRAGDARARAIQRIGRAMAAHPRVVEGEGRLGTVLMEAAPGRLVAKGGAEGLLLVAEVTRGWGVAFKCEDGAARALGPASIATLEALGVLSGEEAARLASYRRPVVTNAAGLAVGTLEAHVRVGEPAGSGA